MLRFYFKTNEKKDFFNLASSFTNKTKKLREYHIYFVSVPEQNLVR